MTKMIIFASLPKIESDFRFTPEFNMNDKWSRVKVFSYFPQSMLNLRARQVDPLEFKSNLDLWGRQVALQVACIFNLMYEVWQYNVTYQPLNLTPSQEDESRTQLMLL